MQSSLLLHMNWKELGNATHVGSYREAWWQSAAMCTESVVLGSGSIQDITRVGYGMGTVCIEC